MISEKQDYNGMKYTKKYIKKESKTETEKTMI